MIKFFRALSIIFMAIFISAIFFSFFPIVMLLITVAVLLAFIWFVVRGVIELIKE